MIETNWAGVATCPTNKTMTDKNHDVWRYSNNENDIEAKIRVWQKKSMERQQDIKRRIDRWRDNGRQK